MFGTLIRQELTVLNDTQYKPILVDIKDNNGLIEFYFLANKETILITHKDTDIYKYDKHFYNNLHLPHKKLIQLLWSSIKSFKNIKVDLEIPLSDIVMEKLSNIADEYIKSENLSLINADFLLAHYKPIIAYNITKILVSKLQKPIPSHLLYALERPYDYFDIDTIIQKNNIAILQDSGAICGN